MASTSAAEMSLPEIMVATRSAPKISLRLSSSIRARTPRPNPQSQSFSRSYGSVLPTSPTHSALSVDTAARAVHGVEGEVETEKETER